MKCNKCLKIIPKGEEIRFNAKNGTTNWRHYGGYYCEECLKKSGLYQYYEDGGKPQKSNGSGIPSWGWFFFGMLATLAIVGIVWFITKDKD